MATAPNFLRRRLDRAGMVLSGLCAAHCAATILVVSGIGFGAQFLLEPSIHKVGLLLAALVAGVAIGWGAVQHGRRAPFVVAMMGLSFMGGALAAPHGIYEAVLTIIGVCFVGMGHVLNLRTAH